MEKKGQTRVCLPCHCLPKQVGSARGRGAGVGGHGGWLAGRGCSADVEGGECRDKTARLVADVMAGLDGLCGRVGGARD